MQYKVVGKYFSRSFVFDLVVNEDKEVAESAIEQLKSRNRTLVYEIMTSVPNKIEISGKDMEGDVVLVAVITPFSEVDE